jgi:hypothetical protein
VGDGVAVGASEGAGVTEGLAAGVGLELAGVVHAATTNAAVASKTATFME